MINYVSAENAVSIIDNNDKVILHGGAATPQLLVSALTSRHNSLRNVEIFHLHTEGAADYAKPEYSEAFCVSCFFVGANIRPYVNHSNVQYIPVFLSEIPSLFRNQIIHLDVAIIQVSPPDKHGYCSLGVSVDIVSAAVGVAKKIIAQVNPNMPQTHGDGQIHISKFTKVILSNEPISELASKPATEVERNIGKHIASLVEDGATLQMGIGGIPNAALEFLSSHKDLGIHTEMFSDGILPLVKSGVINGSKKKNHPGKIVSSFAMGTRALYDFIDDNPMVAMLDVGYVNNTNTIRKNPKVTAINSALEIDLSGQVCADSIGTKIFSGVGGQIDFIRGASLSEGGKPIISIASTTQKGISKIVPMLKQGAGVVTTRANIHYVVTEYGVANLYGKNIAQRAKILIDIAHPDHRAELEKQAFEMYGKCW